MESLARVEGLHNIVKDVVSDIGLTRTRDPGWKTTDMFLAARRGLRKKCNTVPYRLTRT